LASRQGFSATVGVLDVGYLMEAFQTLNSCILSLSFEVTTRRGTPDLMVIATAYTVDPATADRVPLVSWRSSLSQLNCATMEGAITLCLYRIDGLLAEKEMSALQPK
jgi:hypothetical protein